MRVGWGWGPTSLPGFQQLWVRPGLYWALFVIHFCSECLEIALACRGPSVWVLANYASLGRARLSRPGAAKEPDSRHLDQCPLYFSAHWSARLGWGSHIATQCPSLARSRCVKGGPGGGASGVGATPFPSQQVGSFGEGLVFVLAILLHFDSGSPKGQG